MDVFHEDENCEIGWTDVGNYKFRNKNTGQEVVIAADAMREAGLV